MNLTIKEKVNFTFAYRHNAENVAIALCSAGFYVRIISREAEHTVLIYTTDLE